jgi:hypothetical protein
LEIISFLYEPIEKQSVIKRMKKGFSIAMIFLTLTAILQLTVATHYCGGEIAGSKISFSGKVASCGMEDDKNSLLSTDTFLTTHCCHDVIHFYNITANYFPSISVVADTFQQSSPHFNISDRASFCSSLLLQTNSNKSPPGELGYRSVNLSEICILRI